MVGLGEEAKEVKENYEASGRFRSTDFYNWSISTTN